MALERMALRLGACAVIVLGAWLWHASKVHDARQAGWDAAVAAGEKQRAADAQVALTNERALRKKLADADAAAQSKEQTHAETLAAAQRRVRAGTDVLRCPAAAPVQSAATAADGPAPASLQAHQPGAELVPDVAADVLGHAATVAGLVRKYDDLYERAEACIALNNGPAPVGGSGE